MNSAEYARMYENEDHYWWFVSRRELVMDLISRYLAIPDPVIVDIGCGTGTTAGAGPSRSRSRRRFLAAGAESVCQQGPARAGARRAEAIPLPSESVDAIVATDILEHLDDDLAALQEFRRILKPGGRAVITVPAYQFLWSEHDVALVHHRRIRCRGSRGAGQPRRFSTGAAGIRPFALVSPIARPPVQAGRSRSEPAG